MSSNPKIPCGDLPTTIAQKLAHFRTVPNNVYVPVMRSKRMAELAATFWVPNRAKGQPALATVPYRGPVDHGAAY